MPNACPLFIAVGNKVAGGMQPLKFDICGGLMERGACLKFWLRGEDLIREGGLIARGGLW